VCGRLGERERCLRSFFVLRRHFIASQTDRHPVRPCHVSSTVFPAPRTDPATSPFVSNRPTSDADKWLCTQWMARTMRLAGLELVWRLSEWQTDLAGRTAAAASKRRPTEIIGVTIHATIGRARHHRWCGCGSRSAAVVAAPRN